MAKAHFVKKARKDVKDTDIKKGDSYYWWQFRFGGKRFSKEPPRRSQLTQSAFYSALWDLEDQISSLPADEMLGDAVADIAQSLRDMADECQTSLDNIPETLQEAPTGQMLSERVEGCGNAADEFESLTFDIEDKAEDESDEDFWQAKLEEVQSVNIDVP